MSLYEMAYDLALADLGSEECSHLTMVTLLNMALIEKELGNSREAERCLGDLSEYMISLETTESSSQEASSQRSEFLLKATLLLQSPLGAAAA